MATATFTYGKSTGEIVAVGACGYSECKHEVCVTVKFADSPLTRNFEAARFIRQTAVALAEQATTMKTSAVACIDDADKHIKRGEPINGTGPATLALFWLVHSLKYSVGVYHPAARKVAELLAASAHPLAATTARAYGL